MTKKLIIFVMVAAIVSFNSDRLLAQEENYWIQIGSFRTMNEADALVRQISNRVSNLRIFLSNRGRYLVVSGRYPKRQAARIRDRIESEDLFGNTTNITVGRHFRSQVSPPSQDGVIDSENSERFRLDTEDAIKAQNALKWFGDYDGKIDGIIGSGSIRAIQSYQERIGENPTGRLTRSGYHDLINAFETEIDLVGLEPITRRAAGINIEIPTNMLEFDRIEEPFVYFGPTRGHQIQMFLVSMVGNYLVLEGLFQSLNQLDFIPPGGARDLSTDRFVIQSEGNATTAYADVRLFEGRIKGFLLISHPRQNQLMARITKAMSESLQESSERTLITPTEDSSSAPAASPLVELDIPRPKFRLSGFFLDPYGTVATSSLIADGCMRVFLAPSFEMRIGAVDRASGIALIVPVNQQSPLAYAKLRTTPLFKGEPMMLSGYSFAGELGSPSQTNVTWNGNDPRQPNRTDSGMVVGAIYPGDIGGPVLDHTGAVAGILIKDLQDAKRLPDGIHPVTLPDAVSRLAATMGIVTHHSFADENLDFASQTRNANDLTVLVECF